MTTYEELLAGFMPEFYWFRNAHWMKNDDVTVVGTVLVNDGDLQDRLVACINGVQVEYKVKESAYGKDKFWFLPDRQRFDVEFSGAVPSNRPTFEVSIAPNSAADVWGRSEFLQYKNWHDLGSTPPLENIERVSGKGATSYSYHNNGLSDYSRFISIARKNGIDMSTARVLDWGCGCGRLMRHFLEAGTDVYGIDIDATNVKWCKENLDFDSFDVTDLFPPTELEDGAFDLVFANSVLSHLTLPAMEDWLQEVYRLLRPGGIALLSYHGQFSLAGVCSKTEPFVRGVVDSGFNADIRAQEVNDVIADAEYYRHTFMTDQYAERLFSKYFKVEDKITGIVSRFQNLAVLRRQ